MGYLSPTLRVAALGAALLAAPVAEAATYTYVGSWEVDDGPNWTSVPVAYSGKDAAALLFGGTAADYVISTIDSLVANIDFQAWVSTWNSGGLGLCGGNFPCGTKVADSFVTSTGGLYSVTGDTSAYVEDWAVGAEYTNYAFRVSAIPLPAAFPMLVLAIAATGALAARRRKNAA